MRSSHVQSNMPLAGNVNFRFKKEEHYFSGLVEHTKRNRFKVVFNCIVHLTAGMFKWVRTGKFFNKYFYVFLRNSLKYQSLAYISLTYANNNNNNNIKKQKDNTKIVCILIKLIYICIIVWV